jgi:hypothetical protein
LNPSARRFAGRRLPILGLRYISIVFDWQSNSTSATGIERANISRTRPYYHRGLLVPCI